ncbi:hypothetical protein ACFQ08_20420, partial [Streptosporangium algeriense]
MSVTTEAPPGTAGHILPLRAAVAAELTKIWSVRSTFLVLPLTLVLSAVLAYLVGTSFAGGFTRMTPEMQRSFDPLFATFYGLTLSQLPLVVFGVLVVGGEYTSGTITASLTAVPRRGLFYTGKVLAGLLTALGVSALSVVAAFVAAQ